MKILLAYGKESKFMGFSIEWVVSKMRDILGDEPQILIPEKASEACMLPLIRDVDVVVGIHNWTERLVNEARNLKLIQSLAAGVDTFPIPFSILKSKGIKLATAAGGNAVAVAEQALTLLLALAKKLVPRHLKLQHDEWDKSLSIQVRGKTLGIYGLGKIGTELARMGRCLGMKVIAVDKRTPDKRLEEELGLEWLGASSDLDRLLAESDFVAVCAASTPETRGSITLDKLRKMKPTAYLVVVSRGNIIDEEGLLQALNQEVIAGAAMDVWWQYPPNAPSVKGLHRHPKIITSPHIGGNTAEAAEGPVRLAATNIKAFMEGKELVNIVSAPNGN